LTIDYFSEFSVLSVAQKFVFIRGFSFLVAAKGCAGLSAPAAQKSIDAALKRNRGQTTAKLAHTPEI